jgi:putative flippase GtrA
MSATSLTPSSEFARRLAERGRIGAFLTHHTTMKWLRYGAVSVVATTLTLTILGIGVGVFGFQAGWTNVVAVSVATAVAFELNRRWVWQRRSGKATLAQVVPFFLWNAASLALSTTAVHYASHFAVHHQYSQLAKTILVEGADIATFGTLWILQFFLLDRLLFKARHEHETVG